MDGPTIAVFTGNANPQLAQDLARYLQIPLGRAHVGRFSDGEVTVELMENVRGRDVFIVQSTCPPANDHLMELLVMVDACRRESEASGMLFREITTEVVDRPEPPIEQVEKLARLEAEWKAEAGRLFAARVPDERVA